jgi:hypothetical protein
MLSQFDCYSFRWQTLLFWLGLALLAGLFFLGVAAFGYEVTGFPLDDAWIHQTYARNLAYSGQLAFVPGVPSAGSTAPLWSFWLSVGYVIGFPFRVWAYGSGILLLGLTGLTMARLVRWLFPQHQRAGLWIGLFCLFEWHLVWAAVSGMETMLFIWLAALLVERYLAIVAPKKEAQKFNHWLGLGILGGLLVLTRPEGMGLVGLIGLDWACRCWRESNLKMLGWGWLGLATGVAILLVPYILFHLWLTGQPLPNTFYAKQAEYAVILQSFPLWWRLFGGFGPPIESVQGVLRVVFIGPQLLLLPGLGFAAWLTIKERRAELGVIWLWWLGFLLLYAVMLPVTYQHGRYQIPAIPWIILLGGWGTARLLALKPEGRRARLVVRVMSRVLVVALAVLVAAFLVLGAQAYGRDVRFIETEMVATAIWLNDHVASDVLIAAHDIGAIGYFTRRPLIDLAGLVTPQVIPIIRNEPALFDFLVARQADYLATFPSWYPQLTNNPSLTPLFTTNAGWTVAAGGDNMVVYEFTSTPPPLFGP